MVSRVMMRRRRMHMQNGAGFFDILKKGVKFLGSKKARKILDIGRKGLEWAGKAQKGIAGFTGQNGAGMMRGDHPITKAQARKLLTLLKNGGRRSTRTRRTRTRRRGGRRRGQRGGGVQRGGFFSWIFKKIVDAIA